MSRVMLLVALALASPTIVFSSCPYGCATCTGSSWEYDKCTSCSAGYAPKDWSGGRGQCEHTSCPWTDEDTDDFYAKLIVGSVIGIIIVLAAVVVNSMVVCCGVMKEKPVWIIAIVAAALATIAAIIPWITGAASGDAAVDDYCDRCNKQTGTEFCTEKERDDASKTISGLGVLAAYIHAFGWLVVVLSIVACSLSCCMCCPCCGPLKTYKDQYAAQQSGAPAQVVGAVVGQPVADNSK